MRLTNSATKEANSGVTIREVLNRLAEYEDLEERLGFNLKEFSEICVSVFEGKDREEYRTGIFLTNDEAEEWREYKRNREVVE